ncbi:hypothetical protein BH11PLA2_BH11PLA2_21170 [soil metagenome]
MTAKKTTKATSAKAPAKAKPAKAKPATTTVPKSTKPDIIDAGGGILVEIAPSPAKPAKGKPAKKATTTEAPAKKMSALDAAHEVLTRENKSLNAKELIDAMTGYGIWTSPGGKTPHATLYAAMLREITTKGDAARFRKTTKGHFAATTAAVPAPVEPPPATPKVKKSKAATKAAIPDGTPGPKSMSELFRL